MPTTVMGGDQRDPMQQARRRAVVTAVVAALLAVGFYVAYMLFMHFTHQP